MEELTLKYGCNPNQVPARVFADGGLPFTVLNGRPGYINLLDALNSWQLVRELKAMAGLPFLPSRLGKKTGSSPPPGGGGKRPPPPPRESSGEAQARPQAPFILSLMLQS